jgi:hypothetical protein
MTFYIKPIDKEALKNLSTFNALPSYQRRALAQIPYRIGIWMSYADDEGGEESAAIELQTVERIIESFGEDCCKSEFVEDLIKETIRYRGEWHEWLVNIELAPLEARHLIKSLTPILGKKEINSLKHTLMDIAQNVADAYHEDIAYSAPVTAWHKISDNAVVLWSKLTGRPYLKMETSQNVSRKEKVALLLLAQTLKLNLVEGCDPIEDAEDAA